MFLQIIGRDLLNKYDAATEKVADNKELMQFKGGHSVVYGRSSEYFEIV